jgi:hypothetical protein
MTFDWVFAVQKECHSTDCDQKQQEHEQCYPAPDLFPSSCALALPAYAPSSFFVCHKNPSFLFYFANQTCLMAR